LVTVRIASTLNPSAAGQPVTFTATLTGSAGTPSGTVTFNDNGTAIPACTLLALSGGAAQCTAASLAVGAHSITVTYSGDATYRAGTSNPFAQTVNTALVTVRIASTLNPSAAGQPVTFTATLTGSAGTPSGTVTFNDNGAAIPGCALLALSAGAAQCATASLAVGAHSITVTYSGDAAYRAGTSNPFNEVVNGFVATLRIESMLNPSTLYDAVTFTAALTGIAGTPSGTVTFNENGTMLPECTAIPLSGGTARCVTSSLAVGTHSITYIYSGDASYLPGTSSMYIQTVNGETVKFDIHSTPNSSMEGQAISLATSLTGADGTPSGAVTFNDNGNAIDSCTTLALSAGAAQCTTSALAVGAHAITVTYSGDATYAARTSTEAAIVAVNPQLTILVQTTASATDSEMSSGVLVYRHEDDCGPEPVCEVSVRSPNPVPGLGGGAELVSTLPSSDPPHLASISLDGQAAFDSQDSLPHDVMAQFTASGSLKLFASVPPGTTVGIRISGSTADSGDASSSIDIRSQRQADFHAFDNTTFDTCYTLATTESQVADAQGNSYSYVDGFTLNGVATANGSGGIAQNEKFNGALNVSIQPGCPTAVATIDLLSSENPSISGDAITFTAALIGTAGAPSGTVTFNDNGMPIIDCSSLTLSAGVAQCPTSSLAVGPHRITVTYSGDAAYAPEASDTLTQAVN
jgi:aerobic-type carbon monoxide dehydrogenase small subunit (CoxS/CutS family)